MVQKNSSIFAESDLIRLAIVTYIKLLDLQVQIMKYMNVSSNLSYYPKNSYPKDTVTINQKSMKPQHSSLPENVQSSRPKLDNCYYHSIGLIRINWRNAQGKLVSINYGTAVAVNSRTLVTCSHNLYSQKRLRLCSDIVFIPGIFSGTVNHTYKQYKVSSSTNFAYSKPKTTFSYKPQRQEISMVLLQEQLDIDYFMPIGQLENSNKPQPLQIVGYPSKGYQATIELQRAYINRVSLEGNLVNIDDYIINHSMQTQSGHSGSPIIAFRQNGLPYIVGIHTHRGLQKFYNSGVYFNQRNIQTLKQYQDTLCKANNIEKVNIFKNNANFSFYQRPYFEVNQQQDFEYACKLFQFQYSQVEIHHLNEWNQKSVQDHNNKEQQGRTSDEDEDSDNWSEQSSMDRDLILLNFDDFKDYSELSADCGRDECRTQSCKIQNMGDSEHQNLLLNMQEDEIKLAKVNSFVKY